MMRLMVRAQRPHCGLQPRQPYSCAGVRADSADPASALRTSSSLNTLQEQTIMGSCSWQGRGRLREGIVNCKEKSRL